MDLYNLYTKDSLFREINQIIPNQQTFDMIAVPANPERTSKPGILKRQQVEFGAACKRWTQKRIGESEGALQRDWFYSWNAERQLSPESQSQVMRKE